MGLESQSVINPRHKSRLIKADQPSIAWIKFITPSSSFGPSLERPVLESAQISWISLLSVFLIFLDLVLVICPTRTCNGSLNALWCSSNPLIDSFSLDRHNYSGESPHKDNNKDEFLNIIDRMIFQKWYTEITLVVHKEFSLTVIALVDLSADMNCI